MKTITFECAGERMGVLLNLFYQRGLEIAIAGLSIINGRSALMTNRNGQSMAPFLDSALKTISKEPYVWASLLIGIGLLHFFVLAMTLNDASTSERAFMAFIQTGVYVAITTAILTAVRPLGGGERYAWVACLSFLCFVVLASRAISQHRAGSDG